MSLDGIFHVERKKTITIDDRRYFAPQGLNLDFDIEGEGNIEVKCTTTYFREEPLPYLGVWQLQAGLMATGRKKRINKNSANVGANKVTLSVRNAVV